MTAGGQQVEARGACASGGLGSRREGLGRGAPGACWITDSTLTNLRFAPTNLKFDPDESEVRPWRASLLDDEAARGEDEQAREDEARQVVEDLDGREEHGAAEGAADVGGRALSERMDDCVVDLRELGLRVDRLATEEPVEDGGDGVPYGCEAVAVIGPLGEEHYGGVDAGVGVEEGFGVAVGG